MIKDLEQAIEKIKRLPVERQAYAAEVLEQIATSGEGLYHVPEEHRAAITEALVQAERGEFADEVRVTELLRRPWA
ncbi:MAG: hypothetical protein WC807_05480 [Hyphomicrobium sp.]|jgi:hypothetical protein